MFDSSQSKLQHSDFVVTETHDRSIHAPIHDGSHVGDRRLDVAVKKVVLSYKADAEAGHNPR